MITITYKKIIICSELGVFKLLFKIVTNIITIVIFIIGCINESDWKYKSENFLSFVTQSSFFQHF